MKYCRILLFSVFGFLVFGPVTEAYSDGHKKKCGREVRKLFEDECGVKEKGNEEQQVCGQDFRERLKDDPENYLTPECAVAFRERHGLGDGHGDHDGDDHGGAHGWHCEICDLDFDSAEEMDAHAEEAGHLEHQDGDPQDHLPDSWHCAICDLDFDSAEEMDAHAEEAGHLEDREGESPEALEGCKKEFRKIVREECSEFERGTDDFKKCFRGVRNKVRDDLENHLSPECHDVFLNSPIGKRR